MPVMFNVYQYWCEFEFYLEESSCCSREVSILKFLCHSSWRWTVVWHGCTSVHYSITIYQRLFTYSITIDWVTDSEDISRWQRIRAVVQRKNIMNSTFFSLLKCSPILTDNISHYVSTWQSSSLALCHDEEDFCPVNRMIGMVGQSLSGWPSLLASIYEKAISYHLKAGKV